MPAFNPAKPKLAYQLTFGGSWPTSVAFLGSGNRLASANQLGQIYVWDLPDVPPKDAKPGAKDRQAPNVPPVRRLDGHTNEVTRLAATPDGKKLISASYDHTVRVWPTDAPAAGKAEATLDGETKARAPKAGAKPGGEAITVETQTACEVLKGHADWVQALGLNSDGTRAVTGDESGKVFVWNLADGKPVSAWAGQPWCGVFSAALSPDGQTAFVSEYRYKRDDFDIPPPALKLWNAADGKEKLDLLKLQFPKLNPADRSYGGSQMWRKFVANGLLGAAFSPDGKLLAVGQGGETDTGKVHLFDAASGKFLRDVSGHLSGVTDLLFTPDSKYLITTGRDTCARVVQVADGKEVSVLHAPRGGQFKDWLSAVALSPDARRLAAADIAGVVHVWDCA